MVGTVSAGLFALWIGGIPSLRWQVDTATRTVGDRVQVRVAPLGRVELHDPQLGLVQAQGPARLELAADGVRLLRGRALVTADRAGALQTVEATVRFDGGTSALVQVADGLTVWVEDGGVRVDGARAGPGEAYAGLPGRPPRVQVSEQPLVETTRSAFDGAPDLGWLLRWGQAVQPGPIFSQQPEWFGEWRLMGAPSLFDGLRERAVRPPPIAPERVLEPDDGS